jgi:hypothetical protein
MIGRAMWALGAAAAAALGVAAGQAGQTGAAVRAPGPGAVLDDFHDAAAKADYARYFSHWTEESVFLGTDATERWVGNQFGAFAKPIFEKGKGWTYRPHDRQITAAGDAVFFDELLDNERLGLCRGSGVLRRVGGEWKVLQYNLSIPIPNEKALQVAELIRAKPPSGPHPSGAAPGAPPAVPQGSSPPASPPPGAGNGR